LSKKQDKMKNLPALLEAYIIHRFLFIFIFTPYFDFALFLRYKTISLLLQAGCG